MKSQTGCSRANQEHGSPERSPCARSLWWWLRLALVLAMTVGLVVIAKPARLWLALAGAQYLWLLAGVPVAVCAVLLDALKLYWLVRPVGFSGGGWSVTRTTFVVNFVSLFLPGTVGGGAVLWQRLSRADNLRAQVFVALSLNIVVKIIALCGLGALALALDAGAAQTHRAFIAPLVILAALPVLALLLGPTTGLVGWIKSVHVSSLSSLMPQRLHDALRKMLESLEAYRSHRASLLGALAANAARLLVEYAGPLFCLYAVGVKDVPYVRVFWIMCAVEVAGMIPISLSVLGLSQVAFVALLAAFNIPAARSVACLVVMRIPWLPVYLYGAALMLQESFAQPPKPAGT